MTRQELIQKRNEVLDVLIAEGWDEDDARFAIMTAAAKPDGLLADQLTNKTHPALIELAKAAASAEPAQVKTHKNNIRLNSDDEMEDQ